jgi:hypothetical protein
MPTRVAAVLVILAALVGRPTDAAAELAVLARNHLGVGRLSSEALAHPDDPTSYTYGGWVLDVGMEAFAPWRSTRFGGAYGPHLRFDALFYSPGVWTRQGVPTEQIPALLFMDVEGELGVALSPIYSNAFDMLFKFDLVAGTTRHGVSAALESSVKIGKVRATIDLALRTGTTWQDALWREQRTRVGARFDSAYVWFEIVRGYSENEMEQIDYGTFLRGGYLQGQLVVGWQLR